MKQLLLIAAILGLSACGQSPQPDKVNPVSEQQHESAVDPAEPPKAENLKEAIAIALPYMKDKNDGVIDAGAATLTVWGADRIKWSEIQEIPAGKHALVMKDPDTQRGKRICTSGRIVEIAASSVPRGKIYLGGMLDDQGNTYRFVALRSTGELVSRSRARFCGIITGQQHYENSMGGVAHAVQLVGMFDLPENK